MKRRRFLATLAALGTGPISFIGQAEQPTGLGYLSVRADRQRRYFLSGIDIRGRLNFDLPLPERAHAVALHPGGEAAVVIARRPGTFLQIIDLRQGRLLERLECKPGRHLYGHGIFSRDGKYFYTTENDFEAGRGVIGVRDVESGYKLVDEFDSGGVGPHELRLMPDTETLVIANGGIRTHPDFDRSALNLETMRPSLVYIDRRNGLLLETRHLPQAMHQNSIRHLAVGSGNRICIAMQYQGPRNETPPLVALHHRGETLKPLSAPPEILSAMKNYCGSVCADGAGECFAVSSPRGDLVTFWSREGSYLKHTRVADGCGIAPGESAGEFLLSSGLGGLYRYSVADGELQPLILSGREDMLWDNHMTALS